jgi:hypothetical protein
MTSPVIRLPSLSDRLLYRLGLNPTRQRCPYCGDRSVLSRRHMETRHPL